MIFKNERQDSALLVELDDDSNQKSLILNLNDSGGYGFEKEVASISRKYKNSFYLRLHCWGDADMINLFDNKNNRIPPSASLKFPVGKDIKNGMKNFNCNISMPFSCHHQYQRRDSFWANDFVTPIDLMKEGFNEDNKYKLLPAFQKIMFKGGKFFPNNLNPERLTIFEPIHESQFGDNWNSLLDKNQVNQCREYFQKIKTLFRNYKSIILKVGGVEHEMLKDGYGKAKITFEVPSSSLMKSIRGETFDDLLIGNFMKTYLNKCIDLYYPDFTMAVCKYSDNGGAKAEDELDKYFQYYNNHRSTNDKLNIGFVKFKSLIKNKFSKDLVYKFKNLLR